jgi:hypothetical protein
VLSSAIPAGNDVRMLRAEFDQSLPPVSQCARKRRSPMSMVLQTLMSRRRTIHISPPPRNINRGRHCPRNLRSQRLMFLRPEPTPGLPMPRYLDNELLVFTARTSTSCPTLSNTRRSPARNPKGAANVARYGYLPFARDFGLLCVLTFFLALSLIPCSARNGFLIRLALDCLNFKPRGSSSGVEKVTDTHSAET